MTHLDYADIVELIKTEPQKQLRLHWEGCENPAQQTTPDAILEAIVEGEYGIDDFDTIGYCVSEEDYNAEQSQGE